MYLSKSDFKAARSCPTKLYYKKSGYPSAYDENEYMELLAEGGYIIQKLATLLYPHGQEIPFTTDPAQGSLATQHALERDDITLFEPTLISEGKLARIDILQKQGNELHLIEVKATSYDSNENERAIAEGRLNLFRTKRTGAIVSGWREYLEDVTFQVLALRELFPNATIKASLMMPDKSKSTSIDRFFSLFQLRRSKITGANKAQYHVEFTGDVQKLRREHFLTLVPVDAEVESLAEEVARNSAEFVNSLNPNLRRIATPISIACRGCEYRVADTNATNGYRECWGHLADIDPHLLDLYHVGTIGGQGGPVAADLIKEHQVGLFDVPRERLVKTDGTIGATNQRQLIQIDHTRDNTEWMSEDLQEILGTLPYPLHFIDFETTTSAIPYHAGMHPYEPVAFQWSCHTLESPDTKPRHADWINVEDAFPNFEFAETLMQHLGRKGTVFMWATHENTMLRRILEQMQSRAYQNPELARWLRWITRGRGQKQGRLVDMNQLCLKHYFHPLMRGRTSIKVVSDAVWKSNPKLRAENPDYVKKQDGGLLSPYASLPSLEINGQPVVVAEGTGAIRAYEAMMFGVERDDKETKSAWRDLLRQYCELDTLSMVWIWNHWHVSPLPND